MAPGPLTPAPRLLQVPSLVLPAALALAGLLAVLWPAGSRSELWNPERDAVPVEVVTLTTSARDGVPVVILKEKDGRRALPIWVGVTEGNAIWQKLNGVRTPRPLTHDLARNLLVSAGVGFERAVITKVDNGTYYAVIILKRDGRAFRVDSRPSDAIALALRFGAPLLVSRRLMNSAASFDLGRRPEPIRYGGMVLQELTADLARQLGAAGTKGVLVADAGEGRFSGLVRRGDIVIQINGSEVGSLLDAALRLKDVKEASPLGMTLMRAGRRVRVRIPSGGGGE